MTYQYLVNTQMSATKGIKLHGERAVEALLKEFAQLDNMNTFRPIKADSISKQERSKALRLINLIKEKRDGTLKGRTCADGRSQRSYISKEEAASPACSNEALMITMVVAAYENRKHATCDVTSAYLHADQDDFVVIKVQGQIVDILCAKNPGYEEFVVVEGGKRTLYMQLLKALYGCIKSALLWYNLFTDTLMDMGFELNPYDNCVANKMIDGKQCTIIWWVDDNYISHVSDGVLDLVIGKIEERFGKMSVTRGDEHVFLGMKLRFPGDGTVRIMMKEYIEEAIVLFGEKLDRIVASPATSSLFILDPKAKPLPVDRRERLHRIVGKLLWVCKRGRPDVDLTVAYLCTRVSKATTDDWRKLRRLLNFLQCTIDDERIVSATNLKTLFTWVDASYAVHPDMRSHTGGTMSLGGGVLNTMSAKQKLNTKSSTEAEVIGASDYLPKNIWAVLFLEAQGHHLDNNIFFQDNLSAMKLERNGLRSCGQKSRHIDVRHFWIMDRIRSGDIDLRHCPTEDMLADYFTKPLQGAAFQRFRSVIMGWKPISTLFNQPLDPAESKERVE